jgi:hypothetical protein
MNRSQAKWPVRLSVRTSGFQPEKRGSTPLRAATCTSKLLLCMDFILLFANLITVVSRF